MTTFDVVRSRHVLKMYLKYKYLCKILVIMLYWIQLLLKCFIKYFPILLQKLMTQVLMLIVIHWL